MIPGPEPPTTTRIRHPDDPRVADFRDIPDKALLKERGLFVAEGRLVVRRLLESNRFSPRAILLTDAALEALTRPLTADQESNVPVYLATPDLMRQISGFNFHRGCLAIGERPDPTNVSDLLAHASPGKLVVVVERVGDADNVGGIIRNAAAFGAAAVLLSPGCCDPLYRKAIRTSVGACLQLPFATLDDWSEGLGTLRGQGYHVVALTPASDAEPLDQLVVPDGMRGVALLLGNEGDGLSASAVSCADARHRIDIESSVDSLNVATAAAVALHTLRRVYLSRFTTR